MKKKYIAALAAGAAAGAPVQLEDMKGTFHGSASFWKADISRAAVKKRIEALRQGFRIPRNLAGCLPKSKMRQEGSNAFNFKI